MARGRLWSADDSARLRRLVRAGAIDVEIAAELGRPRETITRKRKTLGLQPGCSPSYRAAVLRMALKKAREKRKAMTKEANDRRSPTTDAADPGEPPCEQPSDATSLRRHLRDPDRPVSKRVAWLRERPEFMAGFGGAREALIEDLADSALDKAWDATTSAEATTSRGFMHTIKLYAGIFGPRGPLAARPSGPRSGGPRSGGPTWGRPPAGSAGTHGRHLHFGETIEEAKARAERMRAAGPHRNAP